MKFATSGIKFQKKMGMISGESLTTTAASNKNYVRARNLDLPMIAIQRRFLEPPPRRMRRSETIQKAHDSKSANPSPSGLRSTLWEASVLHDILFPGPGKVAGLGFVLLGQLLNVFFDFVAFVL